MIPSTISSLEILRLIVACMGVRAAWKGRALARQSRSEIPHEHSEDVFERMSREQRDARMTLLEGIQFGILLVHVLLMLNVLVNFGYSGGSIEQPNVITSNLAQILIPIILTRVSELITMEMQTIRRLREVAGERPPPVTNGEHAL